MNFARDVLGALEPSAPALLELARDGARRTWTAGEVDDAAARLAGTLARLGVSRGDVVMTIIGNRPEWVLAMVACFRIGAVVLPCTEQLRPHDLRLRLDATRPVALLADVRNREVVEATLATDGHAPAHVLLVPDAALLDGPPAPAAELDLEDPCLLCFTSGTSGPPKAVLHAQRYLTGQALQAERWLDARPGDLVWCTAASGWSKSARNVFLAPWLRGACALLHDARFDPAQRLEVVRREGVDVLCMAPTEYRMIAARAELGPLPSIRGLVAAGEALDPGVLEAWRAATGVTIRDGYGQTETGQLTGSGPDEEVVPGSMGRALPGIALWVEDGELVVDPATVPTMCLGTLGADGVLVPPPSPWRTGDRVEQDAEGRLRSEGRTDDVISSAGYRIGPAEVEAALCTHPAVADAGVVAAPDAQRGSVVRAVVVLRDGEVASPELAAALQEHVKAQTAPYKHPRILEFADALPRTTTGKLRRAALRGEG